MRQFPRCCVGAPSPNDACVVRTCMQRVAASPATPVCSEAGTRFALYALAARFITCRRQAARPTGAPRGAHMCSAGGRVGRAACGCCDCAEPARRAPRGHVRHGGMVCRAVPPIALGRQAATQCPAPHHKLRPTKRGFASADRPPPQRALVCVCVRARESKGHRTAFMVEGRGIAGVVRTTCVRLHMCVSQCVFTLAVCLPDGISWRPWRLGCQPQGISPVQMRPWGRTHRTLFGALQPLWREDSTRRALLCAMCVSPVLVRGL